MRQRRPQRSAWTFSLNLGAGVSLASLCLALLGYGYALAVESTFGIEESLFADGALDYVRLSSLVVAFAISALSDGLTSSAFYVGLYDRFGLCAWAATLLWAVALLALRGSRWQRWLLTSTVAAVHRLSQHGVTRGVVNAVVRGWMACRWGLVSLAAIWVVLPGVVVVLLALVGVPAVLVAAVPLLGYEAGNRSLQQWVVEPEVCLQPRSRDQRMDQGRVERAKASQPAARKIRGVACVAIREKGHPEWVQGRLVVANAQWAVLFDPASGSVKRVAVQNAEMVPVGSLDVRHAPPHAALDAQPRFTAGTATSR